MIEITYFIDHRVYASRTSSHVPRVGDLVRFKSILYKIKSVTWIEDDREPKVAIDVEPEK